MSSKLKDKKEEIVYGRSACKKLFEVRPSDIIRVYVREKEVKSFSKVLKWCADQKKAYHLVSDEALEKITGSVHHEDICFLVKTTSSLTFEELLKEMSVSKSAAEVLLYLDGVQNPHNVGAILRSCAHFGVRAVLADEFSMSSLAPSAKRIAVGAAETVPLIYLKDIKKAFTGLKRLGFMCFATAMTEAKSIFDESLPKRCLFLMGAETVGVSKRLLKEADDKLLIPGTGKVESLNVSSATAVILAEYWKQHRGS